MSEEFTGFESPSEHGLNVPVSFFEIVLARENASTIRVVAYILARTLTGAAEVCASYDDFMSEMKLSRSAVYEGVHRAIEARYVIQYSPGRSTKSVYRLNWSEDKRADCDDKDPNNEGGDEPDYESAPCDTSVPDSQIVCYQVQTNAVSRAYKENLTTENPTTENPTTEKPTKASSNNRTSRKEILESCLMPKSGSTKNLPLPPALALLCQEFSRELGDISHLASNSTQTLNLWRSSGLAIADFAACMYTARDLTKRYATLRPGEVAPTDGTLRNRGAYFFTVLRNLVKPVEVCDSPKPRSDEASTSISIVLPSDKVTTDNTTHYTKPTYRTKPAATGSSKPSYQGWFKSSSPASPQIKGWEAYVATHSAQAGS